MDVLQFLRSQDPPCPWDEHTCFYAVREGHLEVLKWLRDQDPPCPWGRRYCKALATGSEDPYEITTHHQHIIDWIDRQEDESDCDSEEQRERERMREIAMEEMMWGDDDGDYDSDGSYDSYSDEYF